MNLNKRQTGVGLIEALVAALVFAFGITALVQLQGTFFKNSSAANARSAAMSIAQQKLEDLRGFQIADSPDNDIFDFTAIGTNTGGRCTEQADDNACTVALLSTGTNQNIAVGNIGFSRNWTVTNYYYDAAGLLCTPFPTGTTPNTCTAATGTIPDQKRVVVNVAWSDTDGSAQTLALEGLINRNSGASIGALANFSNGGAGQSPVVPYTPSVDVHVTPIGVGTDTKRETLVPSTETVAGYSRTKFIAYTYNTSGILVREEEFQNVACDCRFNGTSTDADKTYTAAHPLWNTDKDTYIDVDGDRVSGKVKGCVQGGGSNCAATPDPLCNTCCRDHHDSASATFKFEPFRSSDGFVSGNHKHYNGTAPVTTGQYLEACRLKRVDGNWRVFEDWHMVKFTVLPLSDLIDSTIKETYANYVKAIIDGHLDESKVAGEPLSSPPAKPSSLDHTVSSNYVSMSLGDKRELSGRGVYLDYVDSTHLTKVKDKKTANQDYLLHLPFYELEVASLNNWDSSAPTSVKVGPYDGPGTSNDLIGGELHALVTNASAVNVTGTIKKSNSGIVALSLAVDYNAVTNPDSSVNSDFVSVCLGCSGPAPCSLPWGGSINSGNSTTAYQAATVPNGQSCVSQARTCTNGVLSGSYTNQACSVLPATDCATPWGTSLASGSSVTAYLSSTVVSPSTCTSENRVCSSGTLSGSYTKQSCTVNVSTCSTTVTGKANRNTDTITLSVDGSPTTCSVAASRSYTCPAVTTPLTSTITVSSSGSVNSTVTVSPICGAKTVNF